MRRGFVPADRHVIGHERHIDDELRIGQSQPGTAPDVVSIVAAPDSSPMNVAR